ncbi:MAG: extracellular solute-binding protein [Thermomicrobiales bacterium]
MTSSAGKLFTTQINRRRALRYAAAAGAGVFGGTLATRAAFAQSTPAPVGSPVAAPSSFGAAALEVSGPVEIEYWQYELATKTELMNQLIPEFQAANPNITVTHVNYPYDDFRTQVAAAVQAGEGPDVLNVFYGWIPSYVQQQFLVQLPPDIFPTEIIEAEFFPTVQVGKIQDAYYALPTAVRTLALFYNVGILEAAGQVPPTTWEELVAVAQATVQKDGDTFNVVGITSDIGGQGHSWWRECLIRQNGSLPFSDETLNRTLNWTTPEAIEAFKFVVDFQTELGVTQAGFETDGPTAFGAGKAALHIDGSYRVGSLASGSPDLNYGVVPLPANKEQASFASFWANTITRNAAEGDKLIASAKFIDFLASSEVQTRWTPTVGELPARTALAADPALLKNPKLAPFIQSLPYSYATFTVNESDLRQTVMDAYDQVTLNGLDIEAAIQEAQDKNQAQYDEYWASLG